ncbi:hypothetical protein FOXG_12625 [Fusarium oxysporum f. sp. lycopersici 4287]|uniref:Uncharacterized protein n=1 Tax=Fusarium oxysporum f. sp. lycopersici (strain 4287 / CBS 123668 / FGSC 9935 / NRRL 34936) TaxID=426428 RepID=A0A0J9WSD9_FUSO4|nr:hypothetical protein FOXG_12625 [Fusarium oxysporum f. sp. lycopersici 4287]KNB14112.1 hypothetical protein FOXG_12625 [Fusarium oxysporum f. sp. lycopersici 4287]
MVTQENKDKLGYIVAYQEMLLWFMRTAREGIRRHGASLGGPSAFMDAPPQDHAIVSHVRHVLVRISGRSNRAQLELLGTHVEIIDLSLMFRYLIGGYLFTKLSLEMSLTTRYLPDPWVSRLPLQQKKSFEALVGPTYRAQVPEAVRKRSNHSRDNSSKSQHVTSRIQNPEHR